MAAYTVNRTPSAAIVGIDDLVTRNRDVGEIALRLFAKQHLLVVA